MTSTCAQEVMKVAKCGLEREIVAALWKKTWLKTFKTLKFKKIWKSFRLKNLSPNCSFSKTGVSFKDFARTPLCWGKFASWGRWCHPAMATNMVLALQYSRGMRGSSAAIDFKTSFSVRCSNLIFIYDHKYIYIYYVNPEPSCLGVITLICWLFWGPKAFMFHDFWVQRYIW